MMDNTVNLQNNQFPPMIQNPGDNPTQNNNVAHIINPPDANGPLYFGDYEAVKAIGKGKFAVVYRAHRIGDEEIVALKRISVDMMNDKAREKCLKEVRLLQSLDHPNIIRYMDSFITDNDLIIVYEWAAAGDLKRQIRKAQEKGNGFEERVIWKYFSQIANAIQHMHDRRIMHRDLKPANIFLTLDGTIKVGDLGLSREFSEHTHQAHSKVGTPLYMSPEVIQGVDGYDFKSDVWSLGCLLYELAVLKSPFKSEGINLYSLLHKISSGDYTPIPDHFSPELRDLAHAMISTKPEDRPDIQYICEVAQRMRIQTMNDRSSKLRRSMSKSEDFANSQTVGNEAVAERKNDSGKPPTYHRETSSPSAKDEADDKQRTWSGGNRESGAKEGRYISASRLSEEEKNKGVDNFSSEREKERSLFEERKEVDPFKPTTPQTPQTYRLPPKNNANPFQSLPVQSPPPSSSSSKQYAHVVLPSSENGSSTSPPQHSNPVYRRSKPPRPESANKTKRSGDPPAVSTLEPSNTVDHTSFGQSRPVSGAGNDPTDDPTDYQTLRRKESTSNLAPLLENASPAFALMDVVYCKLQLLGYPMYEGNRNGSQVTAKHRARGRLLPFHFAVNLNIYDQVAGHEGHHQFQLFARLVEVIRWICCEKLPGSKASDLMKTVDIQSSNPIVTAKQVLLAAQEAGTSSSEVAAVGATSLLPGFGYPACLILNHFADCALNAVHFKPNPWLFPSHREENRDLIHAEVEESVEESSEDGENDADGVTDINSVENYHYEGKDFDEDESELAFSLSTIDRVAGEGRGRAHSGRRRRMVESTAVDPRLWREETERIVPLLRRSERAIDITTHVSWQSHVALISDYCRQNSSTPSLAIISSVRKSAPISETMRSLQQQVSDDLKNILTAERLLNSRNQMAEHQIHFQSVREKLESLETSRSRLQTQVQELSSRLTEKSELLEELQELLQEKMGGSSKSGEAEANPIIRFKEGIQRLQAEIKEMYVTSSFLSHQLLRCRQRQQISRLERVNKHRRKRLKYRNTEQLSSGDEVG